MVENISNFQVEASRASVWFVMLLLPAPSIKEACEMGPLTIWFLSKSFQGDL